MQKYKQTQIYMMLSLNESQPHTKLQEVTF